MPQARRQPRRRRRRAAGRRLPWWLPLVLALGIPAATLAVGWHGRPSATAAAGPAWSYTLPGASRLGAPAGTAGVVAWGDWGAVVVDAQGTVRQRQGGPVGAAAGDVAELWTTAGGRVVARRDGLFWAWQLPGVVAALWPDGGAALAEVRQGVSGQLVLMSASDQPQWYVDLGATVAWSACATAAGEALVLGGLGVGGTPVSLAGLLSAQGWRWRWTPPGDGPLAAVACGSQGGTWWLLPHAAVHLDSGGQVVGQAALVGVPRALAAAGDGGVVVASAVRWWWVRGTLLTAVGPSGAVLWARRLAGTPLGGGVVPDGAGWAAVTSAGVWYVAPGGGTTLVSPGQPDAWAGGPAGLGLLAGRQLRWYPAPGGP